METARALLERGQAVVIFPEGTRIRTGSLARPKRGVGRLALQSGKPVVPIAVTNSEHARRGWRIRPVKVHLRCGPPLTFPRVEEPVPVPGRRGHRAHLAVRRAPVGVARRPAAAPHRRGGRRRLDGHRRGRRARRAPALEVQLGCRTAAQAEALRADGENARYMPGLELDRRIDVKTVPEIEFAGVDLVVLAVPCASLPAAVGEIGARMGDRSRRARGVEGARAAARHDARRLRGRARARARGRHAGRSRARARGDRARARRWWWPPATPTSAASSATCSRRAASRSRRPTT